MNGRLSFSKAERKLARLRIGLMGIAGSGKTWSALELATGLGGKIALLDTERRGHLYASDFEFDICELDAPYTPERYAEIIRMAEKAGYETLIIDSLSHAWQGEGGILSIVENASAASRSGNSYMAWGKATPRHQYLVDTIITSKLNIIVTLRTKSEYALETNDKGRVTPRKVGTAPIQRDGLEYEFTIFADLDNEHCATITKDNTRLFDGQRIRLSSETGQKLRDWMLNGKTAEEMRAAEQAELASLRPIPNTLEPMDLKQVLIEIHNTVTMQELEQVFVKAQIYFRAMRDDHAIASLVAAKDKKKSELQFVQQSKFDAKPSVVNGMGNFNTEELVHESL